MKKFPSAVLRYFLKKAKKYLKTVEEILLSHIDMAYELFIREDSGVSNDREKYYSNIIW